MQELEANNCILYYSYFSVDIFVFSVLYFVVCVSLLVWVSLRLHVQKP